MWARALSAAVGVWAMVAPGLLQLNPSSAKVCYAVAPWVVAFSVVAFNEATRALRWVNLPLGVALAVGPGLFTVSAAVWAHQLGVGLAVIGLCFWRGRLRQTLGGGWRALRG